MKSLLHPTDRDRIRTRLESLRPDSARQWGRMSCAQMICHVGDEFRVSLGELTARPTGNLLARTVIKFLMLRTPLRSPKGSASAPELDQERGGTRPQEFDADRRRLLALVSRFAEGTQARWPDHPFFGPFTHAQWARFHYKHLDHHLRQFGA